MLRVFQQPAEGRWMDFGRILDDWETIEREHKDSVSASQTPHAPSPKPPDDSSKAKGVLESWLEKNVITDKDAEEDASSNAPERNRESRRLAALKPEAVLDLHGMAGEEAESAIAVFLDDSSREGTRESTDHPRERPALFRNPRSQKGGEEGDRGAPGCGAIRRGQKD